MRRSWYSDTCEIIVNNVLHNKVNGLNIGVSIDRTSSETREEYPSGSRRIENA